jgi:hypothetical protein
MFLTSHAVLNELLNNKNDNKLSFHGSHLYQKVDSDEIIWTGLLECISKIVTMDIFGIIW